MDERCIYPDSHRPFYGDMINEVELLEELPYYRTLQKPPQHQSHSLHHTPGIPHYPTAPRGLRLDYDETSIAIIAPDIRAPQNSGNLPLEYTEQYTSPSCPDIAVSALGYLADVGTDVAVCYILFLEQRVLWAGLAASFVLFASMVVNVVSIYWFVRNQRNAGSVYTSVSKLSWVLRALSHVFFLGMVYRYTQLLCKCICGSRLEEREHRSVMEARKRRQAILQMNMRDDKQTAALSLMHALMASAPQLVLQLYILSQRTDADPQFTVFLQGSSAGASLFQLAWSITSYNGALHRCSPRRRKPTVAGKLLQLLWHLCTCGSRACTLALFTREYHFWLFPFCIGHWGICAVWVMHQQTRFCKGRQCREYACNLAAGVAYVIYYLNVKAEPTRLKYSAYYALVFVENCALMTLWFLRSDPGLWYHIPALVAVFSSFASGLVFMLTYYGFCHRTVKQTDEKRPASCC